MGKLVLADVDGTILQHDKELATPRVTEAVWQMHVESHKLIPVTSRTAKLMGLLAMQLELPDAGVLDGGATWFDFRQDMRDVARSRWMSSAKTLEVIEAIGGYCTKVYYGEESHVFGPKSSVQNDSPSTFAIYPNAAGDSVRVALLATPGISFYENAYNNTSTLSCVQVVSGGVSKKSGVQLLLSDPEFAQYAPEDIVAIGDGVPDVHLLLAVPDGSHRIAVGDNPTLRQVANAVVSPASEDGFAIAMERFVLR